MSRKSPNSYSSEKKGSNSLEGKGGSNYNSGSNQSTNTDSEKMKYQKVQEKIRKNLSK